MQTLIQLLETRKAETLAWIAIDPDNRWASHPVVDLEHWHGYGIYNVEQFEAWEIRAQLWDFYKEVMGFRPRGMNIDAMSDDEVRAEMDSLVRSQEADAEHERQMALSWEENLAAYAEAHPETSASPFASLRG